MKLSNTFILRTTALAIASVVVGCGGGGGTTTASTTTTVAPRVFTSSEGKLVAGLGLLTVDALSSYAQVEQSFFANLIQGLSAAGSTPIGSSPSVTIPCASGGSGSGSFSAGVSKSGVYVGLKTNDTVNLSFSSCALSGTGITLNGQAIITATADNLNLGPNFLAQYRLTTSNFEISVASCKFRSSGTQNIRYNATAAGGSFPDLASTVTSNYAFSFFNPTSAAVATVSLNLNPSSVLNYKVSTSNTFVTSFTGSVQSTTQSGTTSSTISATTPLSGPWTQTAGRSNPTSGVLNVTDVTLNLATSTTIQPVAVFVKFDSNGDGSLESTYTTSYTALTTF
jgi:hypothetical protein